MCFVRQNLKSFNVEALRVVYRFSSQRAETGSDVLMEQVSLMQVAWKTVCRM